MKWCEVNDYDISWGLHREGRSKVAYNSSGKRQFVPLVQIDLFHRLLGVLLFVYMLTSKLRNCQPISLVVFLGWLVSVCSKQVSLSLSLSLFCVIRHWCLWPLKTQRREQILPPRRWLRLLLPWILKWHSLDRGWGCYTNHVHKGIRILWRGGGGVERGAILLNVCY